MATHGVAREAKIAKRQNGIQMDKRYLLKKSAQALKWSYIGNGSQLIFQFFISVIIARILGPEPFGLIAIAWLSIGFGKLISDLGFSAFVIQNQDLSDQDVGFALSLQIAMGMTLTLALMFLATPIAKFFNRPDAAPVIQAMALSFVIQAISQTTTAKLTQALRLKFIQIVNMISYFVGYILVGLPTAYYGLGVWSLVLAQLVQTACYSVLVLFFSGVRIRPSTSATKSGFFKFGSKVIGANITSWLFINIDSLAIGRFTGITDLGVYNRSMNLVTTISSAITTSLQGVLFAASARSQNNKEQIALGFLAATQGVGFICFPIFFVMAIIPETVIQGIYGNKWTAASTIITPLALALTINALLSLIGPILMALDLTERELKAQLLALLIIAPAVIWASTYSITYVAWSILFSSFFRWLFLMHAIGKPLNLSLKKILSELHLPFFSSLAIAAIIKVCHDLLMINDSTWKLISIISASLITTLLVFRALGPRIFNRSIGLLLHVGAPLPASVAWWLRLNTRR